MNEIKSTIIDIVQSFENQKVLNLNTKIGEESDSIIKATEKYLFSNNKIKQFIIDNSIIKYNKDGSYAEGILSVAWTLDSQTKLSKK